MEDSFIKELKELLKKYNAEFETIFDVRSEVAFTDITYYINGNKKVISYGTYLNSDTFKN